MKIIIAFILLVSATAWSQIIEPVKWTTSTEKISDKEYNILFVAQLNKDWHLYSQHVQEGGPLPTVFEFLPNKSYTCNGKPSEGKAYEVYEDVFEMRVKYFKNKAVFKQRITILNNKPLTIKGSINYMSCNQEKCIPASTNFEILIK